MTNVTPTSAFLIGHFEPLHLGHMRHILAAAGQVETLHIFITRHPNPNPKFPVTLADKARWLQKACQDMPFIHIHICDDFIFPVYDDIQDTLINTDAYNAKLTYLQDTFGLPQDSALIVAEGHPLSTEAVTSALNTSVMKTHNYKEFNSLAIHYDPVAHWSAIHPDAKADYTRTVAIVGGESSGKTTLVRKLANYYGSDFALEMGRLYVNTDLGGTEVGLQYSDYAPIALNHAEAVRQAKHHAMAPVTIIDTDFVTTQAFCEVYENRTHPLVAACINEYRFDHNTPWVDDGMRSLGSMDARARFEAQLTDIFDRHHIKTHRIDNERYAARYEAAIAYIDAHIFKADH